MERLITSETDYTPALDLNAANLTMQFTGVSRPENVSLFYQQVLDWISDLADEYDSSKPGTLKVIFKLNYCNSASQKYILIVLEKLLELKGIGLSLEVDWYYENGDDKMQEDGEDISDAVGLKFNFHLDN
jgi:hypothetical protein